MLFLRTVNTQHQHWVRNIWKELFFLLSCNTYSSPEWGTTGVNLCALVNVLCELAINLCQAGSNGDRRKDLYTCCYRCCTVVLVVYSFPELSSSQPALRSSWSVDVLTSWISLTWHFRLSTRGFYSTIQILSPTHNVNETHTNLNTTPSPLPNT